MLRNRRNKAQVLKKAQERAGKGVKSKEKRVRAEGKKTAVFL
jgi:hypothetical protein